MSYLMAVHLAYRVTSPVTGVSKLHSWPVVQSSSLYHPANVYPVLVGLLGFVTVLLYFAVLSLTSLPPVESKATIYIWRWCQSP